MSSSYQRPASLLLAIFVIGASGLAALVGTTWGWILKCDDSCGEPPPWRVDEHAWQYDALGWVAIGGLACALAIGFAVALCRRRAGIAVFGLWCICGVAFVPLFVGSGLTSKEPHLWLGLAGVGTAAVLALAWARPQPVQGGRSSARS